MALYFSIWIALWLFVAGEVGKRQAESRTATAMKGWWPWSIGALLCVIHMAIALAVRYEWDHDAAVRETARQTATVYGLAWNGGLYINYLFVLVWISEAVWWRAGPAAFLDRPHAVTWALRGFYAIMIVNGALIFASAPGRMLGIPLILTLLWTWRPRRDAVTVALPI